MDKIDSLIDKWGKQDNGNTGLQNKINKMKTDINEKMYIKIINELECLGIKIK